MVIQYVLFDAANTIIHKPKLWERMLTVLEANGHQISPPLLRRNHKLLSECLFFPDRTSHEFYQHFNAELLYSLGIIPTTTLLDSIFKACTYLPWEKFDDTTALHNLNLPLGIVSNFNHTLSELLHTLFGSNVFCDITVSETVGAAKPQLIFYEAALAATDILASEILYVGDSIKLDMEPALAMGMQTLLIDREQVFPHFPHRIDSLSQLPDFLSK